MSKKVIVVGAGIVGVSTALNLIRDGHRVTLLDRDGPAAGTSYGNGGVLASCAMVPVTGPGLIAKAPRMLLDPDQPLFLRWSYLPKLMPWLVRYLGNANASDTTRIAAAIAGVVGDSLQEHQALAKGTKAEKWIAPCDYMYLYRSRADFEADQFSWALRRKHGFTWDELEGEALAAYDPCFAPDLRLGVRMGDHGRITNPGAYVEDLCEVFQALGGQYQRATVQKIVVEAGELSGVKTQDSLLSCDACVLATGVWSGPLAKALGIKVHLEAERGYHIDLFEPSVMPRTAIMFAAGKFVATPMEGRLRLAGVVEFGGLEAGPSRAPFDLLRKSARAAMPTLKWSREETWMGHRPATTDSIPVIGEAPAARGVYLGFGHQHIGLTSGPKTGRLLAQLISGRKPNLDLAPYSPARFAQR